MPFERTISENNAAPVKPSEDKFPIASALRSRFYQNLSPKELAEMVDRLIDSSCNNLFTKLYDSFQVNTLFVCLLTLFSIMRRAFIRSGLNLNYQAFPE